MSTKNVFTTDSQALNKIRNLEDLIKIGEFVINEATSELCWYKKHLQTKRFAAILVRVLELIAIGISAIIPLIGSVFDKFSINPIWITIAIAFAGGLLGIDKYLGFSTGWLRYIKTFMLIEMRTRMFTLEWKKEIVKISDNPTTNEMDEMLDLSIKYLSDIQLYINEETNAWIQEFSASIKEVEDLVNQKKQELREQGK
jgi:hypothetical protein